MGNFHHRALMVSASVSAYTAPALMTICLLTDYWIYGKQTRLSQNPVLKAGDTRILNFTYHRIGLWRECMKESIDSPYVCDLVKYSKTEAKLEKGFKAVSYRSAPSMACFTAASSLLIIAIILFSRGLCKRRRKAVFFISGLLFSISGLLTMVGVTLYVSITTEESVKIDQDYPVMKCSYGYSFLCAVFSFVLQELTGVLTVYWFIYRFRALVRKQEKLRERTRIMMNNCLSMTTALPMNLVALNSTNIDDCKSHNRMKPMASGSNYPTYQNTHVNAYNSQYYSMNSDSRSPTTPRQHMILPKRRLPFEKPFPSPNQHIDRIPYTMNPPRSPTLAYGDYCRVLIRAEDFDLLKKMVKSKSQAHLLANSSRSATPAPMITNTIAVPNSHDIRGQQTNDNKTKRNIRKGIKRTTSV